jgi:hypothetical protein
MIVVLNDSNIEPRLSLGALCEFHAITGIDLIFRGGKVDMTNMETLCYVMLKHGVGGEHIKKIEDVQGLTITQTLELVKFFKDQMLGDEPQEEDKKKTVSL